MYFQHHVLRELMNKIYDDDDYFERYLGIIEYSYRLNEIQSSTGGGNLIFDNVREEVVIEMGGDDDPEEYVMEKNISFYNPQGLYRDRQRAYLSIKYHYWGGMCFQSPCFPMGMWLESEEPTNSMYAFPKYYPL
jgi:hypothetical protein